MKTFIVERQMFWSAFAVNRTGNTMCMREKHRKTTDSNRQIVSYPSQLPKSKTLRNRIFNHFRRNFGRVNDQTRKDIKMRHSYAVRQCMTANRHWKNDFPTRLYFSLSLSHSLPVSIHFPVAFIRSEATNYTISTAPSIRLFVPFPFHSILFSLVISFFVKYLEFNVNV